MKNLLVCKSALALRGATKREKEHSESWHPALCLPEQNETIEFYMILEQLKSETSLRKESHFSEIEQSAGNSRRRFDHLLGDGECLRVQLCSSSPHCDGSSGDAAL